MAAFGTKGLAWTVTLPTEPLFCALLDHQIHGMFGQANDPLHVCYCLGRDPDHEVQLEMKGLKACNSLDFGVQFVVFYRLAQELSQPLGARFDTEGQGLDLVLYEIDHLQGYLIDTKGG